LRALGWQAKSSAPPDPRRNKLSIEDELFERRLARVHEMEALGERPYGRRFDFTHEIPAILAEFGARTGEELCPAGNAPVANVRVAGRVMTVRRMGKAGFAHLAGGGERLQIYVRKDSVNAEDYALFEKLDLGDILGVEGYLFRTKTGELSIHAGKLTFLSKILLALPEKWHGLEDVETRYRQRYLDLIANPDVRRIFVTRARVIGSLRRQLEAHGFIEVETPMMQPLYGGAAARPFVTHHNALDIDLYLRIAPELYLKRLIVGGLDRVYEINRNFRNEGLGWKYNPEFTMLEFYQAYTDYLGMMDLSEELLARVAEDATGNARVEWEGQTLDFARWRRMTMREAVIEFWEGDGRPSEADVRDPEWLLRHSDKSTSGEALGHLFEKVAEPKLFQPTIIYDYPVEMSPLSMKKPGDPSTVERFEMYAAGMELGNAYTELNDPQEQRRRFDLQLAMRASGDEEAHQMDEDYLRALCYGMPPTGGEGIGIDRLTMILTGTRSIRDVILFPQLRPEGEIGMAARLRDLDRDLNR
jgi:lysyl-tRNA synthetase class 2